MKWRFAGGYVLVFFTLHATAASHDTMQKFISCGAQVIKGGVIGAHDTLVYAGMPLVALTSLKGQSVLKPGLGAGVAVLSFVPTIQLLKKSVTRYALAADQERVDWQGYADRTAAEADTSAEAFMYLVGRLAATSATGFALYKGVSIIPKEHLCNWACATQVIGMSLLLFEQTDFFKAMLKALQGGAKTH